MNKSRKAVRKFSLPQTNSEKNQIISAILKFSSDLFSLRNYQPLESLWNTARFSTTWKFFVICPLIPDLSMPYAIQLCHCLLCSSYRFIFIPTYTLSFFSDNQCKMDCIALFIYTFLSILNYRLSTCLPCCIILCMRISKSLLCIN